jgi:hypothetical protein
MVMTNGEPDMRRTFHEQLCTTRETKREIAIHEGKTAAAEYVANPERALSLHPLGRFQAIDSRH